jgi:hypothetical protein
MDSKQVLRDRLEETARILEWAISKIPPGHLLQVPPHGQHPQAGERYKTYFGDWSAYRLFFHVVFYEEVFALPTMRHWLGEPYPGVDIINPDSSLEEAACQQELERGADLPALLDRFRAVRQEQIRVLETIPAREWDLEKVNTELGPVSAEFVVAKTIQHTLDHGNALMRNALYWDRAWEWLERQR